MHGEAARTFYSCKRSPQIAELLGMAAVLLGYVRKANKSKRISLNPPPWTWPLDVSGRCRGPAYRT